jgi:5-methyltetrahydrofolate corrinoid/iron sulfur protein methyltransferase
MLVVGERINGMFKDMGRAIRDRNKEPVQTLARRQLAAGADILDINVGTASAEPEEAMRWLVETVREVTAAPLALDSPKLSVLRAGLQACSGEVMINSTTGKQTDLAALLPLAATSRPGGTPIVGLTIDERGVPTDVNRRVEIAMSIVTAALEHGLPADKLYIDPIILPVKADQKQPTFVLEAIRQFAMLSDPPPRSIVGLSNVSQGAAERPLINRTFLAMAVAAGLNAAILDPLDTELMDAMISAEVLMNRAIYSDGFLKAYRRK